jgi:hypothetical protein
MTDPLPDLVAARLAGRAKPTAELLPGARFYVHRRGMWSETVPVERLPSRLAFYRSLAVKRAAVYAPDVAVLEAVLAQLQAEEAG